MRRWATARGVEGGDENAESVGSRLVGTVLPSWIIVPPALTRGAVAAEVDCAGVDEPVVVRCSHKTPPPAGLSFDIWKGAVSSVV